MRIGLIGVGRIGAYHASTLLAVPAVSEVVLADLDAGRAEAVAARLGAAAATPAELFAGRVDALVVAAQTAAHPDLVRAAADAGLPVFCEKPLAPDLEQTRKVIDHAAGVPLQVGFQRRFDPGYVAARDAVRDGRLGTVHAVLAVTMDATPPPPDFIAGSGGIFRDCHIHDADAIRFVTGREVATVYATGGNKGDPSFAAAGDVATSGAVLVLDDGTVATILGGRYNGGYDVRFEVHGSAGAVAAGLDDRTPLRSAEPGVRWPAGAPYRDFFDRFRQAYANELAAFVEFAAGRIDNPCPPADALAALCVAEAAALSRAEARPVAVAEVC